MDLVEVDSNAEKKKLLLAFMLLYTQRMNLQNQMQSSMTALSHLHIKSQQLYMESRRNRLKLISLLCLSAVSPPTRIWIRPKTSGWWDSVVPKMPDSVWKANFRITRQTFAVLCGRLKETFVRKDSNFRKCIPLEKRVAMCVYVLSSSANLKTVAHLFDVGKSTLRNAVIEFCNNIVNDLMPELIVFPTSSEGLEVLIDGFFHDWQFPQTLGALDGCHIQISPPKDNATDYYSHKKFYSTILLAMCDHAYRFLYINAGTPGCNDYDTVFNQSVLSKMLVSNPVFHNSTKQVQGFKAEPVILADSAFPLLPHLIKPYQDGPQLTRHQLQFNEQLLLAHNVIKVAISRLKARFSILAKPIEYNINNVGRITETCCTLHNLCEIMGDTCEPDWIKEDSHVGPEDSICTFGEFDTSAQDMRNTFSLYLKKVKLCGMMENP